MDLQDLKKAIEIISNSGIGFDIGLPLCGMVGLHDKDVFDFINMGPEKFWTRYFEMTPRQYNEYILYRGRPRCSVITSQGNRCKNFVRERNYDHDPEVFKEHFDGYCHKHDY